MVAVRRVTDSQQEPAMTMRSRQTGLLNACEGICYVGDRRNAFGRSEAIETETTGG